MRFEELVNFLPAKTVDQYQDNLVNAFTIRLATALHQYGAPAYRLEESIALVMQRLGLEGQFLAMPTAILVAFGKPEDQKATLIRVEPGSVDLNKLSQLNTLTSDLIKGKIDAEEGLQILEKIIVTPPQYGSILTALCFGIASSTTARFLGGGWREILCATVIGVILGLISLIAARNKTFSRIFTPIAAIIAAALSVLALNIFHPLSYYITTLAGLIVLVPGFSLTGAITELATRNLISGTTKLTGALLTFLEIGFGVALGSQIGKLFHHISLTQKAYPLPEFTVWIALLFAPVAFMILFKAHPRDIGWLILSGIVSFSGARFGVELLGPEFGVCVGALMLGLAGNIFTRLLDRPAVIMLVPGLMMLVPGSIGYGSMARFLEKDVVSGVEAAFQMGFIAVALVTGLLLANTIIPARKAL